MDAVLWCSAWLATDQGEPTSAACVTVIPIRAPTPLVAVSNAVGFTVQ